MSNPKSGQGFHRQQEEFQRKNSPYAPVGPDKARRPSLQRRILSSGATQTVIKEEESEQGEQVDHAQTALAEQTTDTRKINLLKSLPDKAKEKIPDGVFQWFEWPHPGALWGKAVEQSAGLRSKTGEFFQSIRVGIAAFFQRMGTGFSTFAYKMFESSSAKANELRENMPGMGDIKKKIPGSQQFGQLMDQALEKLSDAMDRKVRKNAWEALMQKDVLFARELNLDLNGDEFFETFIEKANITKLVQNNADFIPVTMRRDRPHHVPELLAFKQLIPQRYPELVQRGIDLQLRTLGYLLTSRFAQQKGKSMDRSSVDFANLVAMSLEDPNQIIALIEDVRLKWKLFNEDNTTRLTQAALGSLGQGLIAKDTFQAVNVTVRSFLRLPPD